jgi:hypothetical protein
VASSTALGYDLDVAKARAVAQRVSEDHLLQLNSPRRSDMFANHHLLDLERTSGYNAIAWVCQEKLVTRPRRGLVLVTSAPGQVLATNQQHSLSRNVFTDNCRNRNRDYGVGPSTPGS